MNDRDCIDFCSPVLNYISNKYCMPPTVLLCIMWQWNKYSDHFVSTKTALLEMFPCK